VPGYADREYGQETWKEAERGGFRYWLGRADRKSWSRTSVLPDGLSFIAGLGLFVYLVGGVETKPRQTPAEPAAPPSQIREYVLDSPVWSVAFSSDGSHVAGTTIAGEMWLADRISKGLLRVRVGELGSVRTVAFSPDSKTLAVSGGENQVRIWDVEAGVERDAIDFGVPQAKHVAFSADGKLLAVGGQMGRLALWDIKDARWRARLEGHQGRINSLAFSPDGSRLYSGDSTGFVKVWDVATASERASFHAHVAGYGGVIALAVSPDGTLLATGGTLEAQVLLWDATTGEKRGALQAAAYEVTTLAFSPVEPLLAVARRNGCATIWDYKTSEEVATIQANDRPLESVRFSNDGKTLATGGADGHARLWNVSDRRTQEHR
jgi:WD40 repeat protein